MVRGGTWAARRPAGGHAAQDAWTTAESVARIERRAADGEDGGGIGLVTELPGRRDCSNGSKAGPRGELSEVWRAARPAGWARSLPSYRDPALWAGRYSVTSDEADPESLAVALCRAQGIPARLVVIARPGASDHCYFEFYLADADGNGHWLAADANLPAQCENQIVGQRIA